MNVNKKYIVSSLVLVGAIAISSISTFAVKSNADEETLAQVKQELQEQIDSKTSELEDKDKKIEELNQKLSAQEETINTLNSTVNSLSNTVENTKEDLNTTKQVQKEDKKELVNHSDSGDAKLQQQVDDIKNTKDMNVLTQEQRDSMKGENDCVQPERPNVDN